MGIIEHGPWGIFTDESADYSAEELLDGPFYTRAEADAELSRYAEDNAEVHVIEPAEEGEDEDA